MNIHSFLDNFTISLSALLLPKSKFFRESIESQTFSEHLQGINLQLPEIKHEGQYELVSFLLFILAWIIHGSRLVQM
jgi:hypothetical protein